MAKSWGSTKGSTSSDKLDYLAFKAGKTTVRIVSPVLPRYVYWLQNKDGKSAPFECLRFNRETEKFVKGPKDPVADKGFKEKDKNDKGEIVALKPKKNYVCWVIDRADNKLKIMEVKATILKGIQSVMRELKMDDPTTIDFVIEKTGKGFDTEYKVSEISAMRFQSALADESSTEFKQHQADAELIGDYEEDPETGESAYSKVPGLDETFPVPTYDEQFANIDAFLLGRQEDSKDSDSADSDSAPSGAKEAASELDD